MPPSKTMSAISQSFLTAKDDGTVPQKLKESLARLFGSIPPVTFGSSIMDKTLTTEMYLNKREEEPQKWECKTVSETTVTPDMTNLWGTMHGGCTSFLIDNCTSLTLSLLAAHLGKSPMIVSQSLNIMFHAPAPTGVKLKIISYSIASGSRITSARCEIYDVTNARLIASGVHAKMEANQPSSL
ncbi:HotDog domain-containing protein [Cristinia sonorae]|uniref:HotDog domain-containing protein n=1 Tax=Cristinia sonorae TaxID=1940300 RepID=A0A8K0XUG3_9AGAR|nr:HotDog domain-containing protein [Cristinia sonorae]